MTFQEKLSTHGRSTGERLVALWGRAEAGDITRGEFIDAASLLLARANAQSAALAELALNALLAAAGLPAVPGVDLEDLGHWLDETRLRKALDTSTSVPEAAAVRLNRLGRSEPVEAGQIAYGEAMQQSPNVEGWVRDLEGQACELCTHWSREGRVWPKGHPMPTHKGCECTQKAVLATHVQDTAATRAKKRRERAIANTDRRSAEVRAMQARQEDQETPS